MTSNFYKSIITAKNGTLIPELQNGKTLESRYNPQRDAELIINNIDFTHNYFIITGISSGVLIKNILEKKENSTIICIEKNDEDINFLKQIPLVNELQKNSNIKFTAIENLSSTVLNTYLPAKYGEYTIIEQKNWINENKDLVPIIQEILTKTIGLISADFSVQTHFGKIWQKNILDNLKLCSLIQNKKYNLDINKNAYIVAAGPTLDQTISMITNDSNSFVISTDTASSTLLKNNIIPDIVISIDGQNISTNHFINTINSKTLYLFDLCSNSSAAQYVNENKGQIIFFKSGHPFSELANISCKNKFLNIYTGSGTVTIAALDLALKLGFKNIFVLGADFAYSQGKAYTKGTYFETLYNINSYKNLTHENYYDKLMFRTELISDNKKKTTQILNAYKQSFEQYLNDNKISFIYEKDIYKIKNNKMPDIKDFSQNCFEYQNFIQLIKSISLNELEIPLLPYIAWLKNKNSTQDYETLLKLAHSYILSYN